MYSDFIARYCCRYHESNVFLGVLLVGVNNVNVNELHVQKRETEFLIWWRQRSFTNSLHVAVAFSPLTARRIRVTKARLNDKPNYD